MHPFQYLASKHARGGRTIKALESIVKPTTNTEVEKDDPVAVANGDVLEDDGADEDEEEGKEVKAEEEKMEGIAGQKTRLISCHLCEEKLKDKRDYEDHVIAFHGAESGGPGQSGGSPKEEIFFKKCPICSKSCKTPGLMKLHMRDAHSDPFAR